MSKEPMSDETILLIEEVIFTILGIPGVDKAVHAQVFEDWGGEYLKTLHNEGVEIVSDLPFRYIWRKVMDHLEKEN